MTSQRNFTKISAIPEIIIHIYKYLDFEDQLRLSRVDSHLKGIFKSYFWKEDYHILNIYKKPPHFVISNAMNDNRLCLTPTEYREFLRLYADEVVDLTIKNHDNSARRIHGDADLKCFENLVSFTYQANSIPLHDVKLMAEKNTNLEALILQSFDNKHWSDELIEFIVVKMLNLKRLCIETYPNFKMTMKQFQAILNESKLESLTLTALLVVDNRRRCLDRAETTISRLKEFDLHTTCKPRQWPSNRTSYFRFLQYLTSLTLTDIWQVEDELLATITETCSALKTLKFLRSGFSNITVFAIPLSVVEFSLVWCSGLSYTHLTQLLTLYNITKFYSTHAEFKGEFTDFNISPLIENLNIGEVFDTVEHEYSYKNNKNLKELTWHHATPVPTVKPSLSLEHCINLHTLEMHNCRIDVASLLQLKSLHKLIMPHPVRLVEVLYITEVLEQLVTLRELKIRTDGFTEHGKIINAPVQQKCISTQVHSVELPWDILLLDLDFWIDLLCGNKGLRLICFERTSYERIGTTLKDIVNHRNFSTSIKTIDMCGFQTDCNYIRNHYDEYLEKLKIQTENVIYYYEDNMYQITLERK